MDFLKNIEKRVEEIIVKINLPHFPQPVKKWIGDNIWWLAAIGAIVSGLAALTSLVGAIGSLVALAAVPVVWFVANAVTGWALVTSIIQLATSALSAFFLGTAVNPLQNKQDKGWYLVFATWIVSAVSLALSIIVNVLSLNSFAVVSGAVVGILWLLASAYLLFELRGEFIHTEKSTGAKGAKKTTPKK